MSFSTKTEYGLVALTLKQLLEDCSARSQQPLMDHI